MDCGNVLANQSSLQTSENVTGTFHTQQGQHATGVKSILDEQITKPKVQHDNFSKPKSRPQCDDVVRQRYLSQDGPGAVILDCSVYLEDGETLKSRVEFHGGRSDYAVLDCGGSKIDPVDKREHPAVIIKSVKINDGTIIPAQGVVVRNCDIEGSIEIQTVWVSKRENRSGAKIAVAAARRNAPRDIRLENINLYNAYMPSSVYFHQGVIGSTLRNSKIVHDTPSSVKNGVAIYLSAESGYNRVENNEIHSRGTHREVMSIDSSEHNIVTRNWFSGINTGGIYLYRNCGEKRSIRYTTPSHNIITDNIFYYKKYRGKNPAIFLGSRNGKSSRSYDCDDDQEWSEGSSDPSIDWGSSADDRDFARHNTVTGNKICNRSPEDVITIKYDVNKPNYVANNLEISCPTSGPMPR